MLSIYLMKQINIQFDFIRIFYRIVNLKKIVIQKYFCIIKYKIRLEKIIPFL